MGKGNQIIRGRDAESVRTFYFDPYGDFDAEKKDCVEQEREELAEELSGLSFAMRRRKVEQMMMDGRLPVKVSDERIYDRMNDNCHDEIDNLAYAVGEIEGFKRIPTKERELEAVLVAGNRECGQVIAESDNCIVVIGDNEHNMAIGCAPSFTHVDVDDEYSEDDFLDEADADLVQTRKRADANYEITDKDISDRAAELMHEAIEKEFDERMKLYKKDANVAMRKIHEYFGAQSISVRSCWWTSSRLKPYAELTEEERNSYY